MNKMRNLISALLGLVVLTALGVGLAWLLGPQGPLPLIYASRRVKGVSRRRRPWVAFITAMTLTLSLLYLAACQPHEVDLPFETVERADFPLMGEDYEDEEPKLVVIAEATELDALENTVSSGAQAQPQDLDFDQYFVVAVLQGGGG